MEKNPLKIFVALEYEWILFNLFPTQCYIFFTLICVLILQSKPIVQYIVMLNVL